MKRFICIMPAPLAQAANDWLSVAFGESAGKTFTVGINQSGDPNRQATHMICNWQVSDTDYLLLSAEFKKSKYSSAKFAEGGLLSGEGGRPTGREFMAANGLKRIIRPQ